VLNCKTFLQAALEHQASFNVKNFETSGNPNDGGSEGGGGPLSTVRRFFSWIASPFHRRGEEAAAQPGTKVATPVSSSIQYVSVKV
jgi:hypothetical protein